MKTARKTIMAVLCVLCIVVATITGTLAYLTDTDNVTNTFTVGNVKIDLDEAVVGENGKAIDHDTNRTTDPQDATLTEGNAYHLLPGLTYDKDPRVTVKAGSEESYIRIIMTVHNASAVQAIIDADDVKDDAGNVTSKGAIVDFKDLLTGWSNKWVYQGYEADDFDSDKNTITFEFRYNEKVDGFDGVDNEGKKVKADAILDDLFQQVAVPGYVTNEQLAALYGNAEDATGDFYMEITAHAIQTAGFTDEDAAWAAFDDQHPAA